MAHEIKETNEYKISLSIQQPYEEPQHTTTSCKADNEDDAREFARFHFRQWTVEKIELIGRATYIEYTEGDEY